MGCDNMKNRDLILKLLEFSFDAEICFTNNSVTVDQVDASEVVMIAAADNIMEE